MPASVIPVYSTRATSFGSMKCAAFSGWVPEKGELSRASASTMPCRRVSSASVKPVPTLPA